MSTSKFEATVDYLIHTSPESIFRGATLLNKVLWNADVTAYKANGQSITGCKYLRRQNGPVPDRILRSLEKLSTEGRVQVIEPRAQYQPRKYVGLGDDDGRYEVISEAEKGILIDQLMRLRGMSANEMSEETHGIVWQSIGNGV